MKNFSTREATLSWDEVTEGEFHSIIFLIFLILCKSKTLDIVVTNKMHWTIVEVTAVGRRFICEGHLRKGREPEFCRSR